MSILQLLWLGDDLPLYPRLIMTWSGRVFVIRHLLVISGTETISIITNQNFLCSFFCRGDFWINQNSPLPLSKIWYVKEGACNNSYLQSICVNNWLLFSRYDKYARLMVYRNTLWLRSNNTSWISTWWLKMKFEDEMEFDWKQADRSD